MLQLISNPLDTLSASASSINEAVKAVQVTADMVNSCGSERSARYAALATAINVKDVDSAYTKACLYASWKEGFKAEKNTMYKSLAELAGNCGESRQAFAALAKVGAVFFPSDESAAKIAKKWTDKRYSPYTLFDLAGLPYMLLDEIADTLNTYNVKPNGESSNVSSTHARLIKEAYAACGKDAETFEGLFLKDDGCFLDGDTFIARVCNWKLIIADRNGDSDSENSNENDNNKTDAEDKADRSGFSTYTFIVPHADRVSTVANDSLESVLINELSDNGYKIIGTETNRRGVIRTFVHEYTNDIRVIGVFPLSVKSIAIDVKEFNEKVRTDMENKGVGEYFHEFTTAEYVESVTAHENPVKYLLIDKNA